jgi:hypothetical protein
MVVAVLYLTGLLHILENYDTWYFNNNYFQYDEVTGDQRKVHNEELNYLYCSPNIVWVSKLKMRCVGHVARRGERRGVCRLLVLKPEGKRLLGRPRCRWDDDIKMDLQEVGCGAWTGSIWLRIGTGTGDL